MWYAVNKDGTKWLHNVKPAKLNELYYSGVRTLRVEDNEVASMGLPDMSFNDIPIQVKLICVNINN